LRKPGSDNVARWAARSVDAIDRVDRMLQDLLDAMRLDAGAQLPLDLTPTDLVQVARAAIETLTAEYGDRFVLKAPDPVNGYFGVDPMRRAIENLAANAVKYGLEGRPITISVEAEHERALLAVHNQGPAIPPNELETLFVAFRRTHSSEQSHKRGWGLGLAQVRGVAEAHGGSIDVESLPDTGTRFIISVPLDPRPYQKQILTTDGITLKNPTSE
jgi:signal transduction histidine kinase